MHAYERFVRTKYSYIKLSQVPPTRPERAEAPSPYLNHLRNFNTYIFSPNKSSNSTSL